MRRASRFAASLLAALAAGAAGAAGTAERYPDYRAAQQALDRRDCDAARAHLDAFLRAHPEFREPQHRSFYLAVLRVIGDCEGSVVIRGAGEADGGLSPLPEDPPAP